MGENTKIEWAHHTANFWIGCQEVSPACDHCYAKRQNNHWNWVSGWGPHGERKRTVTAWRDVPRLNRSAAKRGARERVFVNSLSDFFDNKADPTWRSDAFALMRECQSLDFLLLTKRPQNIAEMLPPDWGNGYRNVWLGTTAENQEMYDQRRLHLLGNKAAVHFFSVEPMLGMVIRDTAAERGKNVWYICGGESGPGARPMHPQWATHLRKQCHTTSTPFFFKQWGEYIPLFPQYHDEYGLEEGDMATMCRVGKKLAGRQLDGREWNQFPAVPA